MEDLISSQVSRVLEKALDGVSRRHTAISSNIANAETPGYKSMSVNFEANLKSALDAENHTEGSKVYLRPGTMRTSNDKHMNPGSFVEKGGHGQGMIERTRFEISQQGSVDIEGQMAQLAKNSIQYSALTRLEGRNFNALRSIIKSSGS
jgi:flagellar basal-body rod protein FlgB